MNGQQRRHRSSPAPKHASDLVTPRASNNSSGFHSPRDRFYPSAVDGNDFGSMQSSQEVRVRQHPNNNTSNRMSLLDAIKMQHYQYQDDPPSKIKQQYMHKQSRLQQQHRNYSEERQTTSVCSRGSRSIISQRDDSIAHLATPPRQYSQHDGSNGQLNYSRHSDQFGNQQYYHSDNLRDGAHHRSQMKRSLSSGVVDMAKISFQSPQKFKSPPVRYSKDDSYYEVMQQHEADQDSSGKKSKSSKGLLSRASHKIKKRLVGSSSSNGGDAKGVDSGAQNFDPSINNIDHRGRDIPAVQFRGGRDPSPSRNSEQSKRMYPSDDEQRRIAIQGGAYGSNIPGTIYDDQGKNIEHYPSADHSESDMSTLTSNFTYPIGDVMVNHYGTEDRRITNEMFGTPPRAPQVTMGAGSSTKSPYNAKPSGLEHQNTIQNECGAEEGATKVNIRTDPPIEEFSKRDGNKLAPPSDASIERVASETERSTNMKNDSTEKVDVLLWKQNTELVQVNARLSTEIETLRRQQTSNDAHSSSTNSSISQLETEVLRLQAELRSKEQEISRTLKQNSAISEELEKSHETAIQLTKDLESYKKECASNRERVLQSERDHAKMEQLVFNERKKVLSLEAENEMLLNLADEKIGSANNAERATQSEMSAYKEQCKKYRDRVIQLERKVITSESALEATGKMASSLELEKKSLSATVEEYRTATNSLKAELGEKTNKLISVQEELSDLKSKWSTAEESIARSKSRTSDNEQTIASLESENYNLLRKLDTQSTTVERLQKELTQYKQLELDYPSLKKRNDELKLNEAKLRKQLMDAQDAAANSGRLQKIVADNELFIASLQNDFAQARTKHHQQLLEIRSKHSSDIDSLTDELQKEKQAKRDMETKKNESEDKVLDLQAKADQLEQQMNNQSLAHSDELSKMMRQLDEIREKLSASRDETNDLKLEISNKSHTHESLVAELRRRIEITEQQRDEFSRSTAALKHNLEARESSVQELKAVIDERDKILNGLRSDLSNHNHQSNNDIGRLNEVIQRLKQDLASLMSERQTLLETKMSLQSQIQSTKPLVLDLITSLRTEKATLASDIQTQLIQVKAEMIRYVKGELLEYCRKVENQQLNQTMNHQVAVSELRAENNKMELLIKEENNKSRRLQRSIDALDAEKNDVTNILKVVCSKLSIPVKDLADKLDDLLLEMSDAKGTVATLNVDLATTKAELTNKSHESHQLALDNDHLKKMLALTKSQVKETETDASDQNEKARSVIACLEQTLACKEQEWTETRNEITEIQAEKQRLLTNLNESKEKCEQLTSHLEDIQSELATSKNNVALLNDQLRDKTETVHNLNDLLSRASGEAVDKLASHYMTIEDELRAQLHSVKCEKEAIEMQMSVQSEESRRTVEELSITKQELAACVDQLSADLDIAQKQVATLESEMYSLRQAKEQANQIRNLTSTIEKLNDVHVSNEREHIRITDDLIQRHSDEVDALNAQLLAANSRVYELQSTLDDVNIEHSSDLKMSIEFYKSELEALKASHSKELQDRNKDISDLRCEVDEAVLSKSLLQESLKSAEEVCAERDDLIQQLKCSLRDALQNALQADASKRESEDKLAEIAETLSQYEQVEHDESESIVSGSLSGSLHPKSTIERLVFDKQELEVNLAQSERQLLECQSALSGLEAKLSMAEQMNERLQEEAIACEHQMNKLAAENKERLADQNWMEDRIRTMQSERQKESQTYSEIVSRMQAELQRAKRKEEELEEEIKVLIQDCEVETLYKELLDKMKRNEMQYESLTQKLTAENDSLKGRVTSISKENKTLLQRHDETMAHNSGLARRLDDANAHSSTLTQRLADVEDQLDNLRALNDEVSTTSTLTSRHLQQTASELDTTIQAIKIHHATTVQKLQSELEDMRSKLQKSEKRVQELTKLLQENSKVIETLHKKLTKKKKHSKGNAAVGTAPSSWSSSATPSSSTNKI